MGLSGQLMVAVIVDEFRQKTGGVVSYESINASQGAYQGRTEAMCCTCESNLALD